MTKPSTATAQRKLTADPRPRTKRRMARESEPAAAAQPENAGPDVEAPSPAPVANPSKIASVVALLQREAGATLAELVAATGWLPHTTRAALTGLKKKGHVLEKSKRGDVTCYRIVSGA